jgi:hypothetical protein
MKKRRMMFFWAVIAVMAFTTAASASYMTFTNEADFLNQLATGYYLNDFNDLSGVYFLGTNKSYSLYGFSYDISSPGGGLYAVNSAISTLNETHPLLFTMTMTGDPVYAIGGLFYLTNYDGCLTTGSVEVNLPSLSPSPVLTYASSTDLPFFGVISTDPITSLSLVSKSAGDDQHYPTVDHLYVGSAAPLPYVGSAVPLPGAVLLLGAGMARLVAYARRREDA